jgi:hypothetical protein
MTQAEELLDTLDAAIFSGDKFHNREDLTKLREHLDRWNDEADDISNLLDEEEIQ